MNKNLKIAVAFGTAMAFAGIACAGEHGTAEDKVKTLDTDGDGQVSLVEFTAHPGKTEVDFAKVDVNADGYATVAEMEVAKERGPTAGEKKDTRAKAYPVPTTNPKSEVTDD